MACDVCGKTGTPLEDLLKPYQTDDIKAVCPECEEIINEQHSKLTDAVYKIRAEWLKRFIQNMRSRHDNQD